MFDHSSDTVHDLINVKKRNLLINIAKVQIDNKDKIKLCYSPEELKDFFAFKEFDLQFIADKIFISDKDKYRLRDESFVFLNKVKLSNLTVQASFLKAESYFIRVFAQFLDEIKRNNYDMYHEKFRRVFEKLNGATQVIHWAKLPIFDKYLLFNRKKDPELETLAFYEHPSCMEALFKELTGQGVIMSNKSDQSLNKNIQLNIYNRRWGHYDHYCVSRTINGWNWSSMLHEGQSDKEGIYLHSDLEQQEISGPLFDSLKHDSVFFQKDAIMYALGKLWEEADEGRIDFDELSLKMQEIAEWISVLEKTVGETQPEWLGFY